jgi:ParB family chromosome partitioning protein
VHREVKEKGLSVRQVEALVKDMLAESKAATTTTNTTNSLPPAYKRIEDNMASHFSTRVKLDRKKNGKGSIQIEFYNDNDLERILEKMSL